MASPDTPRHLFFRVPRPLRSVVCTRKRGAPSMETRAKETRAPSQGRAISPKRGFPRAHSVTVRRDVARRTVGPNEDLITVELSSPSGAGAGASSVAAGAGAGAAALADSLAR